jgi:predicted metal-dependent peptidase
MHDEENIYKWLQSFLERSGFLKRYPYYAFILARMDIEEAPNVHVMAVSAKGARFKLHTNVDFFVQHPQYLRGVLLHEVHHLVLGHLTNPQFQDVVYPDLMNLAMEISANEYIKEALPGHPYVWKDFTQFGLCSGQSTLERYELLAQARRQGMSPYQQADWIDDHAGLLGASEKAQIEPPMSQPQCLEKLLTEVLAEAMDEDGNLPKGSLAGKEPGQFLQMLENRAATLPFNWRHHLRMFISHLKVPEYVYTRPNRRFPKRIGEVPGRAYRRREHKPLVLAVIDTSVSMSIAELEEITAQISAFRYMVRATIVECDVAIQRVYPFKGQIPSVRGRGGTDFRPVFKSEFLNQYSPDGIIYFTDGMGPYPDKKPPIRTLWVLTGGMYDSFDCPWGKKTILEIN